MNLFFRLLGCLILSILASCGTNVFQSVPQSQPHAVVKPEVTIRNYIGSFGGTTYIHEIDGKKLSDWRMGNTFRVHPGTHTLGLVGSEGAIASFQMITFTAEAGKTYIAKSDQAAGMTMKFWIEEKETAKVVATAIGKIQIRQQSTYTPIYIPIGG
ncbi:MAG: hypothetical protein MUF13_12890 [Akkermansiaceae bacterium]|jgi:hypothetical protein|nr:hypothetical protein [Akkermansiaceae bacterium]